MNARDPITPMTVVERARAGDQAAWKQLVCIYHKLVYMQCVCCGLQPADADAVTSDVFTGIFQSLSRFKKDKKTHRFLHFLRRITTYKIADHLRVQGKRLDIARGGEIQSVELMGLPEEVKEFSDEQVELIWSENELQTSLRSQLLVEAEEHFDNEMFRAYCLVEIENNSIESVAEELGLLPPEVDKKVSRVVSWMLANLSEFPDELTEKYPTEVSPQEAVVLSFLNGSFKPKSIQVYRLKEILGIPVRVVAQELGMTEGAVRTAAHRVRKWVAEKAPHLLVEVRPTTK